MAAGLRRVDDVAVVAVVETGGAVVIRNTIVTGIVRGMLGLRSLRRIKVAEVVWVNWKNPDGAGTVAVPVVALAGTLISDTMVCVLVPACSSMLTV